jgi:hypothetical protein
MAFNPDVALNVQPVQSPAAQTPAQTISQLMSMRGQQAEIALRNAQLQQTAANTADTQAQAAARQRDLADQNTIQQALQNPDTARAVASWDGTSPFPLAGKISPAAQMNMQSNIIALQKNKLALTSDQRTDFAARHAQIGTTLQGLMYNADGTPRADADIAADAPGAMSELVKDGFLKPENAPQTPITGFKDAQKYAVQNSFESGLNEHAQAAAANAQKIKTDAATETMNQAHAGQFDADAAKLIQDKQNTAAALPSVQAKAQNDAADATFKASHGGLSAEEIQQNATARITANAAAQNAAINAKKFAVEFGGDAVKGWAAQVAANPDTANAVPPALKTAVMTQFSKDNNGLPFPKPLTGTAVDQERAAGTVLARIPRIQQLMNDPEIANSLGPILGRLGDLSQTVGTATGLSDSAAAKAQELRTLLNYTVMGEGKALLGGRLPQQMMQQLQTTSVKNTMDPALARGAMTAMAGAANDVLDSNYKQRYGAAAVRPQPAPAGTVNMKAPDGTIKPVPAADVDHYKSLGATVAP